MKLLFDQNISRRVLGLLEDDFHESSQVTLLGLEDASDHSIFQFSRQHNFSIVTFDSDFADLSMINGYPPKVIWLRTGNLSTQEIGNRINANKTVINEFVLDKQSGVLEIQ